MILNLLKFFSICIIFTILIFTNSYSTEYAAIISSCKNKIINKDKKCNNTTKSTLRITGTPLLPMSIVQEVVNSCNSTNPELSIILAKQKINELYACIGYINSGALVRKDHQGKLHLEIVDGTISKDNIDISNTNLRIKNHIIRSLMDENTIKPLNINDIRGRLELLKKSNVFKSINATVTPIPNSVGEAKVNISVKQSTPYKWAVSLDNQQSEATGEYQFFYSGSKSGFISLFDSIGTSISISEGSQGLGIYYTNSLSQTSDWSVSLDRKEAKIITEPLSNFDITSSSTKSSLGYKKKLHSSLITHNKKNNSKQLMWQSKVELSKTNNYLLDRGFSFSAGEEEGEASITSLQTGLEWEKKHRSDTSSSAFSASAGLDLGIEAFGSSKKTTNSAGSDYKIVKAALGYKRSINEYAYYSININGQYSNDLLLASKRIGLGGAGSVRGSEKNVTSFDSSIAISTESTILLPKLSGTPFVVGSAADGNLYGHIFADYAFGQENRSNEKHGLGSFGVGVTWYPTKHSKLNISWAKPVSFSGFTDNQIDSIDDGRLEFNLTINGGN